MTYTANGVCLAVSWLLVRILLFLWFFVHAWHHRAETAELRGPAILLITIVPALLFGLNVFWFTKILRGVMKLLSGQLRQVGCYHLLLLRHCQLNGHLVPKMCSICCRMMILTWDPGLAIESLLPTRKGLDLVQYACMWVPCGQPVKLNFLDDFAIGSTLLSV